MPKPIEFWIAVAIAVLVKIRTSERLSFWQVVTTIVVAVGAAYIASDWVADWSGMHIGVSAALVALTSEGLMRWAIIASADPIRVLREWRK